MPKIFYAISAATLKRAEARAPLLDVLWLISNRKSKIENRKFHRHA
jgi:hypothetical protein